MTHFLARLVDRARGTASRVEPIIPSRFAPADSLGGEILQEISTEIESRSPITSTEPKPAPQRREPRSTEKESPLQSPNGREAEEVGIEFVTEPLLVQQAPEPPQSLVVRPREPQREIREKPSEITAAQPQIAKPKSRRSNLKRPTTPQLLPLDADFPLSNESREPPIVRVTIGRIDVRAAPAPPPPSRKPARHAGPTLTLDAYLKQRKEGAR
jgi:hypothetical protein